MSTLNVDLIEPVGSTLTLGQSGDTVAIGAGVSFASAKILQVLQSAKTDTDSTTSTSFVDIVGTDQDAAGAVWCVKITPVATTSEILVYYTLSAGSNTQWNMNFLLKSDAASPL